MNAEFHLFLPQMRMSMPDLVERARAAERSGFTGMALMDHFAPPLAESHEMWEAITTAGWLLSATQRLFGKPDTLAAFGRDVIGVAP